MADVSNRTLALLLVGAIVVSLGGAIMSLNRISEIGKFSGSPSGFVTSPNGTVSLNVQSVMSITVQDDASIDFGNCNPTGGAFEQWSDNTADTECAGGDDDFIQVRNDGNQDTNVTANVNRTGTGHSGDFIGGTGSYIAFRTLNASQTAFAVGSGGCHGNVSGDYTSNGWTNFTDVATNYTVCTNLTNAGSYHSVAFYAMVGVPSDAPTTGQEIVGVRFVARVPG